MRSCSSKFVQVLTVAALCGCGGSDKKTEEQADPERSGSALDSLPIKFNDFAPSLSADGSRVLFISGRASGDGTATYKAFRVDWPAGAGPGEAVRVTTDDKLGSERAAALSPDGKWAALVVTNGGRTDLYLQALDGGLPAVRLTDDTAEEFAPEFSPDSKLLVWGQRPSADSAGAAFVLNIGDGSESATRGPVKISGEAAALSQVLWLPLSNASYQLITTERTIDGQGRLAVVQRTFADPAGAGTAEAAKWPGDLVPVDGVRVAAGGTIVLAPLQVLSTARREALRVGDFEPAAGADGPKTRLLSEIGLLSATETKPFPSALGYGILGLGLSDDGSAGVAVAREFYRCKGEENDVYGTSLNVLGLPSGQIGRLAPRLTSTDPGKLTFDVAGGLCNRDINDSVKGRIDDKIVGAEINGSATAKVYRILYVSRFTAHFDANCALRTGDPEIYGLNADEAGKQIFAIAKNSAPLEDAKRDGQTPCKL